MTLDLNASRIELLQNGSRSHHFRIAFKACGVRYVRIQFVDLRNQVCFRIFPVSYFLKLLESDRPGITLTKATLGLVAQQAPPGFSAVGEHIYVVDLASFRPCSYAPGHGVFFGYFQEQISIPRSNGPTFEVPFCPRTVLSRLVRYAINELGIQFLVGFESEFTLLKSTDPLVPVNDYRSSTSLAFTAGTVEVQVLEEIADAIQADGIELQMFHKEGGPGQYEVVTGPMSPLEAADALVHTRETIYNIASKHGLRATFAPRLSPEHCGTGAHMHVSVRSDRERPSKSDFEFLNAVESAFLSGLMDHLASVLALTLPLAASYDRMVDGIWSGGTWLCWGVDNREAPVRLTKATSPSSRNFEIRPVDGTSNPYLAVAGVLACGILGIRGDYKLSVDNCDMPQAVAQMTATERAALGVTTRLPLSIDEARRYLAADEAIKDLLGAEIVAVYLHVSEMFGKMIDRRNGESEAQAVARVVDHY